MARPIATVAAGSNRNRAVLMLAIVFGILSFALMFAFLNSRGGGESSIDKALNAGAGAQTVLVATQNIEVGSEITDGMFTSKTIPAAGLVTGFIVNKDDIVGKVATAPIFEGEQFLTGKVTTFEGQTTLSFKIPAGLRALSVMVPHEAWIAAGLPQPGDRVDILAITSFEKLDPLTGETRPDIFSGIIAQDVEVLAVSQTVVKFVPKITTKASTDPSAPPSASVTPGAADTSGETKPLDTGATFEKAISITLALTPEQAAKVALVDAMQDDVGQYRVLPRRKGESGPAFEIQGSVVWSLDELFPTKKK